MKVAITNLGTIVSGDWRAPFVKGDTVITQDGRIATVGTASAAEVEACDVEIDAGGMTAIPGLIDSHVHITFGDYTPRTVGYLESYLHGGVTTSISASEVHVPGRPRDPEGVKALALAAQRCFADYRPGGMRVIAGSVILEPGLKDEDFTELAAKGVGLAKAGFGAVKTAYDYVSLVAAAKAAGMITTCHTGGSSIPGSGAIAGDHLLAMHPHVSFHINGGPTAMPDADFERVIRESEIALQVCTAGNLRTLLLCARLADQLGAFDRFIIATDTPTGSGVMPLGMLYTIAHCASLTWPNRADARRLSSKLRTIWTALSGAVTSEPASVPGGPSVRIQAPAPARAGSGAELSAPNKLLLATSVIVTRAISPISVGGASI